MAAPDLNILSKVVEYIKCSDAVATMLQKQAEDKAANDAKVKELIPGVVDALVKNHCLPEELREKAASLLEDPLKALEILSSTASFKGSEAKSMGTPTGSGHVKKAAVRGSLSSPYCGYRGTDEKESDQILFERLGLR